MKNYQRWFLLASAAAIVMFAFLVAIMTLSAIEQDYKFRLADEKARVEDLQLQLTQAGKTIDRLDYQLQSIKTTGAPDGMTYLGEFLCTAYCVEPYDHVCGTGDGTTATGTEATPGRTVAADWSILPPGSVVYIVGVGIRTVEDKGSAVQGKQLDIAVALHSEALTWAGYGTHDVYLIEAAQ